MSFGDPRWVGGGWISDFDGHDRWLMGLLRSRADAILVGDGTLREEPNHLWTADYVFPEDGEAFAELREAEGRAALPLQVFVSLTGDLPADAVVLAREDLHLVVGTTRDGAVRARRLPYAGRLDSEDGAAMAEEPLLSRLGSIPWSKQASPTLASQGGVSNSGRRLLARAMRRVPEPGREVRHRCRSRCGVCRVPAP